MSWLPAILDAISQGIVKVKCFRVEQENSEQIPDLKATWIGKGTFILGIDTFAHLNSYQCEGSAFTLYRIDEQLWGAINGDLLRISVST